MKCFNIDGRKSMRLTIHMPGILMLGILMLASTSVLHAQVTPPNVDTDISVGQRPTHLASNTATNRIYVSNANESTVSVIDGRVDEVIATIPIDGVPGPIAVNPSSQRVYVIKDLYALESQLAVINATTNQVMASLPIRALMLAVNATTNRIYVVDDSTKLVVINGQTDAVVPTRLALDRISALAINPATNRIYVLRGRQLYVIDGTRHVIVARIVLPNSFGSRMVIDPSTNKLFVAMDRNLIEVNLSTNTVSAEIPMKGYINDVQINPKTNRCYVKVEEPTITYTIPLVGRTSILAIDMGSRKVVDALRIGATFDGELTTFGNRVYAITNFENTVTSIQDPPLVGGQHLGLRPLPGQTVELTWEAGTLETGYYIVRWGVDSQTPEYLPRTGPLPKGTTSFVDVEPRGEELYLYAVAPQSATGHMWLSSLLGYQPNIESPGNPPIDFVIRLANSNGLLMNQLSWKEPIEGENDVNFLAVTNNETTDLYNVYSPNVVDLADGMRSFALYTQVLNEFGEYELNSSYAVYSIPLWLLQ